MTALPRSCALMEGLSCFFTVVPHKWEFSETIRCVNLGRRTLATITALSGCTITSFI